MPEPGPDGSDFLTYIVPKGYVCLDGTSLTVIDVDWKARQFSVMLIAYTQSKVVMTSKDEGDLVNLEVFVCSYLRLTKWANMSRIQSGL